MRRNPYGRLQWPVRRSWDPKIRKITTWWWLWLFILFLCRMLLLDSTNIISEYSGGLWEGFDTTHQDWKMPPPNYNSSLPTLVIQLRGEMGNHLSAIAHGMTIQWYFREHFDIELQPILRHQVLTSQHTAEDSPKWKATADTIQACFPKLREWEFGRGSTWKEFNWRQDQMKELPGLTRQQLSYINGRPWVGLQRDRQPVTTRDLKEAAETLQRLWKERTIPNHQQQQDGTLSMPFLYSESLENTVLLDRYLDEIQQLFVFDFDQCCGAESPRPDETVVHYRNFGTELVNDNHSGLEDVSARQTAEHLLGHLRPGNAVAITTRFANTQVKQLVHALEARDLSVRVIQDQSGRQDFCFLLRAQKEFIGNFQSTFAFWAAILGQAQRVTLYTLDTPRLRKRTGSSRVLTNRFLYNWTHPKLRQRLHLDLIPEDTNTTT